MHYIRSFLITLVTSVFFAGCSFTPLQVTDLQWHTPALLDKEGCPNVDGIYQDRFLLSRRFEFREGNGRSQNVNGIQAAYEHYKKIPFTPRKLDLKTVMGRYTGETSIYEDTAEFYKTAITSVQKQGNVLEVVLMDPAGVQYEKTTLVLDHPQIGCHNGALVIKTINESFGTAEGACGSTSAREEHYRKLNDGTLQITYHSREWPCRINKGKVRESEGTLLFPPAP